MGQAELLAHGAHLVLEEEAQRLDQVEGEVLGQPAHVVVRLDVGGRVAARLDHVGVERALHQELRTFAVPVPAPSASPSAGAEVARHLLEDADEQLADDLALALGVGHPGQRGEVTVGRLHVDEIDLELATEGVLDLVGLAGAHEAGVDEHAGQLVAHGLVHQAAATAESTPPLSAHSTRSAPTWARTAATCCSMIDTWVHAGQAPAHVDEEVVEDLAAPLGVHDLGVELHPEEPPLGVVHGRDGGAGTGGRGHEARRAPR